MEMMMRDVCVGDGVRVGQRMGWGWITNIGEV